MAGRATQPQATKVQQELTFDEANQIFKKAQKAMNAATTKIAKKQVIVDQLEQDVEFSRRLVQRIQDRLDRITQSVGNVGAACAQAKLEFDDLTNLRLHAEAILHFERADQKNVKGEIETIQYAADKQYDDALKGLKDALERP